MKPLSYAFLLLVMVYAFSRKTPGSNRLPGGLADTRMPSDFDPEELERGVEVEMEHTDDAEIAREIAMDHLEEDPEYYDKLLKAGL